MAYTKTTWVNDGAPAINATNLNKIEQGIEDVHALMNGAGTDVQFVKSSGGNDTNDGMSWATAKATIQGAHDALPSTGGLIRLSPGDHTGNATITKNRVGVLGAGNSTEIVASTGQAHGIKFGSGADDSFIANLRVRSSAQSELQTGILIEIAEVIRIINVSVWSIGGSATKYQGIENGAAGIKFQSNSVSAVHSDWYQLINVDIRNCQHGFVAPGGGTNGLFIGGQFRGCKETSIWTLAAYREGGTGSNAAKWWFRDTYLATTGMAQDDYHVRFEAPVCTFTGGQSEQNGPGNHFYVNNNYATIAPYIINGGNPGHSGGAPRGVYFVTGTTNNIFVDPLYRIGGGAGIPTVLAQDATAASNNYFRSLTTYNDTIPVG